MSAGRMLLTVLAFGLAITGAGGFSSDNSSLGRQLDGLSATTNSPITVTVVFTNGNSATLRGCCFVEQIPDGLTLQTLGVVVNGQPVANYAAESGQSGDVYPGFTPYRWVLESPVAFLQNNPVPPSALVQIQYSLTSAQPGSFTLPEFSWSGTDPAATNAAFGCGESGDVQTISFVPGITPSYPILAVSTNVLSFATNQGNSPAGQSLGIANIGDGVLVWTAAADGTLPAWLTVNPTNGTGDATLTVSASSAGLAPGTYAKNIVVTAAGATNSPRTVTVNLTVSNTVPVLGLVCSWPFDEGAGTTANDASGTGNPGTLGNNPTWATGKINGALSFNGVNNYVSTPSVNLAGTRAVTVALWVNRTYTKTGADHALFESTANYNNSTTGFGFFPDDTSVCSGGGMMVGMQGNAGYNLKCYAQPTSGVWHHLVTVLDKSQSAANEVSLYVDGVLQTAQSQSYSSANTNNFAANPFYLMSRAGSSEFAAGVIDDFRIYNRALTATEVQQLYALGTAPDTQPPTMPTNLTATAVSSSQINLAWAAATDNVGVAGYRVFRNGSQVAAPVGIAYADTNLAATTTYSYTVAAFDAAGNVSAFSAAVLATTPAAPVPDTNPPAITITAPANGAVVTGPVTISANATDNVAVVGVQFKADGVNLGAEVPSAPYQAAWNSALAANGAHSLTAAARDAAGNSTTVSVIVTVSNTVPVLGLVCSWPFDEGAGTTANDASGSGNPGTLVNNPAWTTGKINGALSFNGVNNYVSTPSLNLAGTRSVTVALWVNRTYSKAGGHTLFESSANYNNSTTGFGFFPDDTSVCSSGGMMVGLQGNAGYNLKCYAQPTSGVWHHLVTVLDKSQSAANEVSLYVDGVLQTAQAQSYSSANTNNFGVNPLYLMSRGGSLSYSAGLIDDFRIYNRALSVAEVQQLYALGTAPDTQPPTVPTNLTATAVSFSQVNLAWAAAADNVGVAGYRIFRNGSQIATPVGTVYADTNLSAATTYNYTVAAFDAAGNVSAASATVPVTTPAAPVPDTNAPTITIIAPTNGAVVTGLVTVSANATDNVAVVGVQFKVDGANLGAEVTAAPYQAVWSSVTAANGAHTLTATARDAASNSATATVTVTASNTVVVPGLVCSWPFDEGAGATANDASGSGNPGTLFNNPTWTTGKINGALSFNGVNNYVTTPSLNLAGTRAVTVALWVNRTYTKTGADHALFESTANYNNSTTGFGFFPDDTSVCSGGGMMVGMQGNAGYNLKCYAQPTSGVWHHLVTILDKSQSAANEVSLYVDGVLQTAQSQSYSSANTNNFAANPFYLMSRAGSSEFTAGVIDDFRIYNRALTAAEVQQIYSLGTTPDTQAPSVPTNLTATAISSSQVNLAWAAATDNVGVAGYRVFRNASQVAAPVGIAYADTNLLAATTYSYTVAAFDAAGNVSAASAAVLATTPAAPVPDTNAPVITITAPANGAVVTGLVTVSANATDNVAVAGVQFKVDGVNLGAEVTAAPYQAVWNSTNAANGAHTFTATARDTSSNSATASVTVAVSNSVAVPGLVCSWPLDEGSGTKANDASGSGNLGTLFNNPTWTTGKINGALSFNGVNNYVSTPALNLAGTRAVTVALWVNRTYTKNGADHVLFESTADYNNSTTGFGFFPDDTSICSGGGMMVGVQGNAGYNLKCFAQPTSGVWHHLAAVFDKSQGAANEVSLYVDGVLQTAQSQSYSSNNTNNFAANPLYLMSRGGSSLFTAGVIDDFRVYNRALSAAEVQQIYVPGSQGNAPAVVVGQVAPVVTMRIDTPSVQDGNLTFNLIGESGRTCAIEASPDMENWSQVGVVVLQPDGTVLFNENHLFYRARLLP